MRRIHRLQAIALLSAVFTFLTATGTLADTIVASSDVVAGPASVEKTPESTGVLKAYVVASNTSPTGDVSGCNASGNPGESATLTATSDVPADVTIDAPASIGVSGCGSTNAVTFTYTVPATATVGSVVTLTVSGSGGKVNPTGTPQYTSGSITVTIVAPADTTAPSITPTIVGTLGDNDWYVSDVLVGWTVTDPDSAITTATGCDPTTISSDTTGTTLTCSATSSGGTDSASVTIKRDATAPAVALRPAGDGCSLPGADGWCRGTQTAGFRAEDPTSGIAPSGSPDYNFTQSSATEGSAVLIPSGAVSDMAGNTNAGIDAGPYKIDATPPTVIGTPDRDPDANGWYSAPVSIDWSAAEGDTCDADETYGVAGDPDGAAISLSGSCSDPAGNTATGSLSINYDATAPTIELASLTAANDNGWNNGDVVAVWNCSDDTSGVVSSQVTQTLATEGAAQSLTGTCEDLAGNDAGNTQTGINIDKSNPVITFVSRTLANLNGWNSTDVIVNWSCSDQDGLSGVVSPAVDATLTTEGADQAATGTCEDLAGNDASDTQSGIDIDKSNPVITFVSRTLANGSGWNNTDVTVNWSCSDQAGLSGAIFEAISETLATEGAAQSLTGTCEDLAGNTAADTQSGISIDKSNPVITYVSRTPANLNGWNNTDVTVNWSCSDQDGLSGVVSAAVSQTVSSEGAGQSATGTCADLAGNTADDTQSGINIDETDPVITYVSRTPPNLLGWNNTDVTVNWSCADVLSGAASDADSVTVTTEGTNQSATGTCEDLAGNTASDTQTGISIDKTAPLVEVTGATDGSSVTLGATVVAGCTTSDPLSGVQTEATTSGPTGGTVNGVGTYTVTCAGAVDNAGNEGSASITYHVDYSGLSGFLQPINADNSSVFKRGQAVPGKFRLAGDEPNGFDVSAWTMRKVQVNCANLADETTPENVGTVTPHQAFRYDATADQYIWNADFRSVTPGTCWKLRAILDSDQTFDSAIFKVTK